MNKIKRVLPIVENSLWLFPETRDDDKLLYFAVCTHILEVRGETIADYTVEQFLTTNNLPPFETVRRARQKIQAEVPSLRGKRRAERMERQEVFRQFAKERASSDYYPKERCSKQGNKDKTLAPSIAQGV